MQNSNDVDRYIESAVQQKLRDLRSWIKHIAPEAEEKMSYGMPYYGYKGRLVYFAFAKHHIGLYIPPPIIADHAKQLAGYVTSKSAVQFPNEEEIPMPLVTKLVKARMLWNTQQKKSK